jgi:hypothetical protein
MSKNQNEREILEKAKKYVGKTQYHKELLESFVYHLEQSYLAGYLQAQLEQPRQWQEGYDAAMSQYANKYLELKDKLCDLLSEK